MAVDRAERLVDLDVLTLRQPLDDAGLDAVRQDLAVTALQRERPAVGDEVDQRRQDDQTDTPDPGGRVQRDVEFERDDVVHTCDRQQDVERDRHRADRRAHRGVAGTLQQVVVCIVAGELLLDPRVGEHQAEDDGHDQHDPVRHRHRVVAQVELPRREQTYQTVGPHHVDVGLRSGRHLCRVVRTDVPDRVDLEDARHDRQDAGDEGEHRAGLGGEDRHDADADDVLLGAAGAGELRVLLVPDQREVCADQSQDDAGEEQDVQHVEARDDDDAGEVAAEQCPVDPGADDRDTEDDATHGGADAGARQEVVGERVTEEALEHRQDQQETTDDPVGLTRTSERTGEEDAHHVDDDRRGEQQCRPVVDLTDEETAAHLERDVQRRLVRLGHHHAVQRLVGAVVHHARHRRVEEQRQVDARHQQDDEAVQRDLAQHEGPVGGEDLVDLATHARGEVIPRVHFFGLSADTFGDAHDLRSQNAGPTGSMKSPAATR